MYKQLVLLKITLIILFDIILFVCDIFLRYSERGLIDVNSQPIKSTMIHSIIHIDFKWCL